MVSDKRQYKRGEEEDDRLGVQSSKLVGGKGKVWGFFKEGIVNGWQHGCLCPWCYGTALIHWDLCLLLQLLRVSLLIPTLLCIFPCYYLCVYTYYCLIASSYRSVVPDSLWPHGLQPTRLLCPWDLPGKDTGVGCHFLLQGIFPIQGLNPGLLHCRQILYRLSYNYLWNNLLFLPKHNHFIIYFF